MAFDPLPGVLLPGVHDDTPLLLAPFQCHSSPLASTSACLAFSGCRQLDLLFACLFNPGQGNDGPHGQIHILVP